MAITKFNGHIGKHTSSKKAWDGKGKNPAAWSTRSRNHRDARKLLMKRVLAYMSTGDVEGRRGVEGVTHILKGSTYLPGFDSIPVPAGTLDHSARGLRKGMLWGTAMALAGIEVPEDVIAPELPQHLAAMVMVCAATLDQHLTASDKIKIAAAFRKHAAKHIAFVSAPALTMDAMSQMNLVKLPGFAKVPAIAQKGE